MFQRQLRYVQIILTLSIFGGLLIMNTPLLIASLVGLILVWQLEMLTGQLKIDTNEYLLIIIMILLTFLPVIFSGLEKEGLIKLSYVDIDKDGVISISHLKELLESNPRTFVSIMHANNEIGTIQDIKVIGDICKEHNAIFHSDTVQTMAHFPFDMNEISVDFMAASAHKFHGPKGVGFVYISENIQIKPLLRGGGQERNMRAGTENIYGIAALAMAMEMAYDNLEEETTYIKSLKKHMIKKLKTELEDVQFYGKCTDLDDSLYTVLSCNFPERDDSEMLMFNLDILGVACSGGSACSSGSSKGSHVLTSIVPDSMRPGVRFSFSKYNTKEDIDFTIDKLKELFS